MNCPHCGADEDSDSDADTSIFECGSGTVLRTRVCCERQISQLKAELAQSVRRDDPRLKWVIDNAYDTSHYVSVEEMDDYLKTVFDKLQSIISGK